MFVGNLSEHSVFQSWRPSFTTSGYYVKENINERKKKKKGNVKIFNLITRVKSLYDAINVIILFTDERSGTQQSIKKTRERRDASTHELNKGSGRVGRSRSDVYKRRNRTTYADRRRPSGAP